jgi:hypothetical protein
VSVADAFGNAIPYGSITGAAITVSSSGGAGFDNAGAALLTTISCTLPAGAVNCATGAVALNYYQGYSYGFVGTLTAIITGQYPGTTAFSVSSTSGNVVTGTDATAYPLTLSAGPYGAGTTVKLTATPNVGTQPGVPVTFNLCGQQAGRTVCATTTIGYAGSFVGGGQTGFVSNTISGTGVATAVYTLDPTLGNVGTWNDTAPAPTVAQPNAKLAYSVSSTTATTVAGVPASFKILVYYNDQTDLVKSALVAGQLPQYIVVELVDAYGNLAANLQPTQIQIQLSATAGSISATTVYIASGDTATNGPSSFGPIAFVVPTTVAAGTIITLTATGVVSGFSVSASKIMTVASPLPTFSITSPVPTSGTLYSSSSGVTFKGWANVSAGYPPSVTIASINYKIGSNSWLQAAGAGPNKDAFVLSVFMPIGLSTVQFNATDSQKNTAVSSVYNVLVDTAAPTFTFGSATSNTGCVTVTAATAEGDFNTASFTATYGGVAVPSGAISWTGTQTAGTAGSLTATICGLVSGAATLTVTGSTLAGLNAAASETLTVTVPFANSITFNTGTAVYGLNGAFKGITISVTNGWNTAQTIVVYATFKSGSSIYVADGTVTLAAGATNSVFCLDLQTIPAGTYSVTFAAVTTANQAVSAPTTAINVVAT